MVPVSSKEDILGSGKETGIGGLSILHDLLQEVIVIGLQWEEEILGPEIYSVFVNVSVGTVVIEVIVSFFGKVVIVSSFIFWIVW